MRGQLTRVVRGRVVDTGKGKIRLTARSARRRISSGSPGYQQGGSLLTGRSSYCCLVEAFDADLLLSPFWQLRKRWDPGITERENEIARTLTDRWSDLLDIDRLGYLVANERILCKMEDGMGRYLGSLILICLCVVGLEVVGQTTRVVPADYATIQEAIDASQPGDTIKLLPGNHMGFFIVDKALIIQGGGSTAGETVLLPTSWDTGVVEIGGTDSGVVLIENLQVSESWGERAVWITGELDVELRGCILDSNQVAVELASDAALNVSSSSIARNDLGFLLSSGGSASFETCSFGANGTCIKSTDSALVEAGDCDFSENDWSHIWVSATSELHLEECSFIGIPGAGTAAVWADGESSVRIDHCTIIGTENPSQYSPGPGAYLPVCDGLMVRDSARLEVVDSGLHNLQAGLSINGGTYVLAERCTFTNCCNTAVSVYRCRNAEIHILRCRFGSFGARPEWCCPVIALTGQVDQPVELSYNVVGDTGGCLGFHVESPLCTGATPNNAFEGSIAGEGNELTTYYQHARRQCPSWRSPFWPEGFLEE